MFERQTSLDFRFSLAAKEIYQSCVYTAIFWLFPRITHHVKEFTELCNEVTH